MGSFRKFRNRAELPLPFSSFRFVRLVMSPYNPEKIQWTKTPPERSPDGAGSYRICRRELRLPIPDSRICWRELRLPIPDLACCRVVERVTLPSFGSFRVLVSRPRNPYSFTLASLGSFPVMVMSAKLVASLPVASFVTFQIEMADRSPGSKCFISSYCLLPTAYCLLPAAYCLRESPRVIYDAVSELLHHPQIFQRPRPGQSLGSANRGYP
jgi:hypothetical protein